MKKYEEELSKVLESVEETTGNFDSVAKFEKTEDTDETTDILDEIMEEFTNKAASTSEEE